MKKWKCSVCGYIHEGDSPPEVCPLCKAPAEKFEEVVEEPAEKAAAAATRYWKCTVCGYIHEGDGLPDECPLCKASSDKFVEVDAEGKEVAEKGPVAKGLPPKKPVDKKAIKKKSLLFRLNSRLHLHPIAVHTPNGVLPFGVLLLLSYIFIPLESFETSSYYSMIFTLAVMPVVVATGFMEWKDRFNSAKTLLFFTKIFCAGVVTLCLGTLVLWRFISPNVAAQDSPYRWIYLGIAVVMLGAAGVAGHLGGKLVFNARN